MSYASPRWTNEIADCSMPMTFDTYSNCSFGCLYCFAQYQRALGNAKEHYLKKEVQSVNVAKIKKMFLHPDEYGGEFATYIKQRRVMQWGGMSDQFDGYERKYGKTLELLKFFKDIDYPLCFSTKSTWWTKDERYMEMVRGQKNWNFKFSIITLDEQKAHIIEKGVPTPTERLEAIRRIAEADAGGGNFASASVHHRCKYTKLPRPHKRSQQPWSFGTEHGVLLHGTAEQGAEGESSYLQQGVRFRPVRLLQEIQLLAGLPASEQEGEASVHREYEEPVQRAGYALLRQRRTFQGAVCERLLLRSAC